VWPLRGRPLIVVAATILAVLVLLFPPWRARAIRTTSRYAAVPGVEPSTVVDTISWPLQFAPLYAPPRAPLSGQKMHELAARALQRDASARDSLLRATGDLEGRYHVPDVLHAAGELWRDSVLRAAGIPALSSYDLTFTLDQPWIAARLTMLALIAFVLDLRARRGAVREPARDGHR
jgi:hypothetical protein